MQFLDIITIATVGIILAILVLYLVVVYKKGWLKKDLSASESYFLCPNSKCRRVFKDPIWLTDLSKAPPESYQACPHCNTNLQLAPSFMETEEKPELQSTSRTQPLHRDFNKLAEKTRPIKKETEPERKGTMGGIFKHKFQPNNSSSSESEGSKKPKSLVQTSSNHAEVPMRHAEKASERPRACSHHFGYVKTLPKSTSIPDECLWCPWIIDCLAGAKKIEA